MARRRITRRQILSGCSEPGPDDGLDPRLDRPIDPQVGSGGRKTLQLCEQVARALDAALSGAGDDLLRDLTIQSVLPAQGKGRLLVTVAPSPSAVQRSPEDWVQALARFAPLARAEVASAIHRRKMPELALRLVL